MSALGGNTNAAKPTARYDNRHAALLTLNLVNDFSRFSGAAKLLIERCANARGRDTPPTRPGHQRMRGTTRAMGRPQRGRGTPRAPYGLPKPGAKRRTALHSAHSHQDLARYLR
jgi:hypothetical protein